MLESISQIPKNLDQEVEPIDPLIEDNPLYLEETDKEFPLVLRKIYEPSWDETKKEIADITNEWKEKFGINTARFIKIWIQQEVPAFLTKNGMVKRLRGEDVPLEKYINLSLLNNVGFLIKEKDTFESILLFVRLKKESTLKAIQEQKLIGAAQGLSSPNDPKLKLLGKVSAFLDKVTIEIIKSDEYKKFLVRKKKGTIEKSPFYRNIKKSPLYLRETDSDHPKLLRKTLESSSSAVERKIEKVIGKWKENFGVNAAKFIESWIKEDRGYLNIDLSKIIPSRYSSIDQYLDSCLTERIELIEEPTYIEFIRKQIKQRQTLTVQAIQKQKFIGGAKGLSSPDDPKSKLLGEVSVFLDKVSTEIIRSDEYKQSLIGKIKKENLQNARQRIASVINSSFV